MAPKLKVVLQKKLPKQAIATENSCTLSDNALMLIFLSAEHV